MKWIIEVIISGDLDRSKKGKEREEIPETRKCYTYRYYLNIVFHGNDQSVIIIMRVQ